MIKRILAAVFCYSIGMVFFGLMAFGMIRSLICWANQMPGVAFVAVLLGLLAIFARQDNEL